ncbi:helix-turn-helix domain-containing protein [Hanstruepera marina]|uniref:helix-turn-helix domain-containing protein n=1 Tax=Hanstruepera marina TaxID=2873265 RepID=UPI001CA7485D|nr:helix-turn-helix domain-containing protein [Hanstruepera marina]
MFFQQIIIIFSSYFVVQSLVNIYRIYKYNEGIERTILFAVLLLSIVFLINIDFLYIAFGWYSKAPIFMWWIVPLWFSIAPLFYHVIKVFLLKEKFTKWELLNYLPILLIAFSLKYIYIYPSEIKLSVYNKLLIRGFNLNWSHYVLLFQMLIYAVLSLQKIKKKVTNNKSIHSNTILEDFVIIYLFILAYIVFIIALVLDLVLMLNIKDFYNYNGLEILVISFATIFLNNWLIKNRSKLTYITLQNSKEKYATSGLNDFELRKIVSKISKIVESKELFKSQDLKISDLAEISGIKSHHISQAINQLLNKNFFDFINEFRVNSIKKAMVNSHDLKNYSLEGLAANHGFKSSSSFYRIFKKFTGHSPGAYKRLNN